MKVTWLAPAALFLLVMGCTTAMAPQSPTLTNIQLLRAADVPTLSLGEFVLAPGLPARMDRSISIRADSVTAPGDGSFAHYLRQTLETELRGAGKLDSSAPTTIAAQLTQSRVTTALPRAEAILGARFMVTRNGTLIYEKELTVTDAWESNFIGAIAIPQAADRYTALYADLATALLSDTEFRAAVSAAH